MDGINRDVAPRPLADAYAELQSLLLEGSDVTDFLHQLAVLAAAMVTDAHCAVTLQRGGEVASVAGSDAVALRMDEIQYVRGRGPCLEAMHTSTRIDVADMAAETRWGGDYREHALATGVRSSVSFPLIVEGSAIGALNLFGSTAHAFDTSDVQRVEAFTRQAATALTILLRQAQSKVLEQQVSEALATRAVIDQALGILMVTRKISSREAFESLRQASQASNRKVSDLAAELIQTTTGHPATPTRPLTRRG